MPTLFDSHEEFNEWFSKDIESHAENKSAIDESEYRPRSRRPSCFPAGNTLNAYKKLVRECNGVKLCCAEGLQPSRAKLVLLISHHVSDQLSRLHMILKPFMLRRIKKDVENELSDKVKECSLLSVC